MGREDLDTERRVGSVKAAIGLFGETFIEGNPNLKKTYINFPEIHQNPTFVTRELRISRKVINELMEGQAESELSKAKKTVRDLTLRIEESNSKAKLQMQELRKLKQRKQGQEERALAIRNTDNDRYAEVMQELQYVKRELSKLKLDMASVLEKKDRAEKEVKATSLTISSYLSSADALRTEIEELNEEQVLVELAQLEASKELLAIEAQRQEEADRFSSEMESTKRKINEVLQEIDRSKELEVKLAVTTSDIQILENEIATFKEVDKRVQRNESSRHTEELNFGKGKELDSPLELRSVMDELESAKKELASIREEGFQFMASMDVIRDELNHVSQQTSRLKKKEKKADFTVQNLSSKLLRAKAKLEAVSSAEEKAKTIVSNLSLTSEQLKSETEAAKKERELISEETTNIKAQIEKTKSEIELTEERLVSAMQEIEAVKSSETVTLEKLKTLTENTMIDRASLSKQSSMITISKFEYEYLTSRAVEAEEIADKKVAAAQAWIEALKADEKETLMKMEMGQRKMRELKVEKDKGKHGTEKSISAIRVAEGELSNWRGKQEEGSEGENLQVEEEFPGKSVKRSGSSTPVRKAKLKGSGSPGLRHMARSGSFKVKRRRNIMPNLGKLFNSKGVKRES